MLGCRDLCVSVRLPARTPPPTSCEDPRFYAAVNKVVTASKKYRRGLMIVAFKTNGKKEEWLRNFNLILPSANIFSLVKCHKEDLAKMKAELSPGEPPCGTVQLSSNGCEISNGHKKDLVSVSTTEITEIIQNQGF